MRFCDGSGCIIGGELASTLPEDPHEYDADRLPRYGCNRLTCDRCGEEVRSIAGYEVTAPRPETLYETEDLVGSGKVTARVGRQYLCRCASTFAYGEREQLRPDDGELGTDLMVPWRCGGHPAPTLPHRFDGVLIVPDAIPDLVNRSLQTGWTPEGARAEDRSPGVWIARLYFWLAETPYQETVEFAVMDLMDSEAAEVKSRALRVLSLARPPRAAARCFEVLVGDRVGWAGQEDVYSGSVRPETLVDTLWRLAGPLVKTHVRARLLLERDAVTRGGGTRTLYAVLARHHASWFAEHVEAVLAATPTQRRALERACRLLPRDGTYARALERLARRG